MTIELNFPVKLPAVPNREPAAKHLQGQHIKRYAAREPERNPQFPGIDHGTKTIELGPTQTHLRFETDKDTGVFLIKIIDSKSGELVRQILVPELLNITKSFQNLKGLFVSKEF